jgi:hypothetical protein
MRTYREQNVNRNFALPGDPAASVREAAARSVVWIARMASSARRQGLLQICCRYQQKAAKTARVSAWLETRGQPA